MAASFVAALYIHGHSARSIAAIALVRQVFEACAPGAYQLEVVDVQQQPARAQHDRIRVTPTLVRAKPLPRLRIVGNLNEARVVEGLALDASRE